MSIDYRIFFFPPTQKTTNFPDGIQFFCFVSIGQPVISINFKITKQLVYWKIHLKITRVAHETSFINAVDIIYLCISKLFAHQMLRAQNYALSLISPGDLLFQ